MRHQLQWGYASTSIGAWWYLSVGFGGFFAMGSHGFLEVWRNILLALAILACLAAPVVGVMITRAVTRHIAAVAAKKRMPKLRGPLYADYAYIL